MSYTNGLDKPTDYFNTVLRSGLYGGSDTAFTVGFQPDWIWDKRRSGTSVHALFDSVRSFGSSGKVLYSNTTGAEATNGLIDSVNSTGFTIKASADNTGTLVDWCWKAGGSASSNSNGSITSSVSANTTAGFSIVSWTANGSNGATIGHGLGVTPAIVITKRRSAVGDWLVGGSLIDTVRGGANSLLLLNGTNAMDSNSEVYQTFSSTTFQVGTNEYANTSGSTMIAYCFAEKKGYSKFGSYTGNGASSANSGTFVYTGFKPSLVIVKNTGTEGWQMWDNKRSSYNGQGSNISPNSANAESTGVRVHFFSNGYQLVSSGADQNSSGATFIYMCFAESPFTTSTGIPTTAR